MAFRITATETRNRLKNLTTADISDSVLEDLAFIEASEAEIDVLLTNSSLTYSSLSSAKQVLIKAAEIAMTCEKIVTDAPEEDFKTGALDSKGIKSTDKRIIAEELRKEWQRYLSRAGVTTITVYTAVSDGDDMIPDSEDLTNILFNDIDETEISLNG